MFQGPGLLIALMMLVTIFLGGFCAALVWFFVLTDDAAESQVVIPRGFFAFVGSVVSQVAAWIVCGHLSFEVAQRPMLGYTVTVVIAGFLAILTCVLCLLSCFLSWLPVHGGRDFAARVQRGSSTLLAIIWILGLASYVFG